jgi:membrane glycosyltransferase
MRRVLNAVALTIAVYAFAAWVYVAMTAITQPQTLHLPLTHLESWPRTDTFGSMSFAASLVGFLVFVLTRERISPSSDSARSGGSV